MKNNPLFTYRTMEKHLQNLQRQYSTDYFDLSSLGTTYGQRNLYVCRLGNPDAKKQFVITASIHGREYINTTLLVHMIEHYLSEYENYYQEKWPDLCVFFLPMLNPDGVCISMFTDAKSWKENGHGVDLNRNFPCGFGKASDRRVRNPGKFAGDQQETRLLMDFVNHLTHAIGIIHYHSRGRLIYYDYDVTQPLRTKIETLAYAAHRATGYRLATQTKDTKPSGGFGDWCVYEKKIPSITIETGYLKTPVPHWQLNGILEKNLLLLENLLPRIT